MNDSPIPFESEEDWRQFPSSAGASEDLYNVLSAQLEHEFDARHESSVHEATHRVIAALQSSGALSSEGVEPEERLEIAVRGLRAVVDEWKKNRSKDQPHAALNRACGAANEALLALGEHDGS